MLAVEGADGFAIVGVVRIPMIHADLVPLEILHMRTDKVLEDLMVIDADDAEFGHGRVAGCGLGLWVVGWGGTHTLLAGKIKGALDREIGVSHALRRSGFSAKASMAEPEVLIDSRQFQGQGSTWAVGGDWEF